MEIKIEYTDSIKNFRKPVKLKRGGYLVYIPKRVINKKIIGYKFLKDRLILVVMDNGAKKDYIREK